MRRQKYVSARMRRLRMVLHQLRKHSGMTASEAAHRIGVTASTISRAETGARGINRDDLSALLAVYRAPREVRLAMLKLFEDADKPGMLDRGELVLHADLEKWIGFEQDAARISNYELLLIPGLLQTFHTHERSSRPVSCRAPSRRSMSW
jgi:transcriptional regulator with XRE-family HTH domain